ncbi:MAG: amidase family protein, partial [Opitutus sp.]
TAGWFTNNAADMATAIDALVSPTSKSTPPRGCYLDWPDLDADVRAAYANAAARFTSSAAPATTKTFRHSFERSVETYSTVVAFEAWQVHKSWADRYREQYDPVVWQRLERGMRVTDAQYEAARQECHVLHAVWSNFFCDFDFLVMPATPFGALTKAGGTLANRQRLIALTSPASIGGLPVLTIPVTLPSGLTTGLQIIAPNPKSAVWSWALKRS